MERTEWDALRVIETATNDAVERLRNPRQLVVSYFDVQNTRSAVDTVLEAIENKLLRITAALERGPADDETPVDLRVTAENAVAQLRVALEWASLSSDGVLFNRIQALVIKCENLMHSIQALLQNSIASTSPTRRQAIAAWTQQIGRLRASSIWQDLAQLRTSPAWSRLAHSPADVFELVKLGYIAKATKDPNWGTSLDDVDDGIDSIRWQVSQLLTDAGDAVAAAMPVQHISVSQIDHGPLQVYVCVRHRIRGPGGACVSEGTGADVMLAPSLPPGFSWEPCGAAVLFVSVWSNANLWFWKAALDPASDGLPGQAHGGFLSMMRDVWPRIVEALAQRQGASEAPPAAAELEGCKDLAYLRGAPVWLLGHSMGAALAILAAPRMLRALESPAAGEAPQVRVQVTGTPRVFDVEAAAAFDALSPRLLVDRHFHSGDVINSVPASSSWSPGPWLQWLCTAAALARHPDDLGAAESRGGAAAAVREAFRSRPDDVLGFRHVGSPCPRPLPREEVGWFAPWGAWAGSGFAKVQGRRLHDASAYRRAEDFVPLSESTCYPWWVQVALGGASLLMLRWTGKQLVRVASSALQSQRANWLLMRARQHVSSVQLLPFGVAFSAMEAAGAGHPRDRRGQAGIELR